MTATTDDVLRALAEPRRRAILQLVSREELPVGRLADAVDVTRSAVSQHLRVLREAGLVVERRDGTRHYFRARPEGLAELRAYLDETWAGALDVARRLVEEDRGLLPDAGSPAADGTTGTTGRTR